MQLISADGSFIIIQSNSGEQLFWDVSAYERTRLQTVVDVFKEINEYLATRDKTAGDNLFKIYKDVHDILQSVNDPNALAKQIGDKVYEIFQIVPYEAVEHWFKFHGNVLMPDNLKTEYGPDDPPDRTYLKRDYIDLVILTIVVRLMVPIWGEYINRIKYQTGSVYKEYAAMRLMGKAKNILESAPMAKLRLYVQKSIVGDQRTMSAIFSSLGTAELPEFLLSLVVVRRLSVGDVNASLDTGNVISNIYGFLTGTLKDLDRKFGGGITEKHHEDDSKDDDAISLVESYKVKQEVNAGDIAILKVFSENVVKMAQDIDPTVPKKMVTECVKAALKSHDVEIEKFHKVLCQWLIKPAMSPDGLEHLDKAPFLHVMGVCQAVLWHWGFPNLAALVTAKVIELPSNTMVAAETRLRIPNHLVDKLCELYPFSHPAHDVINERKLNVGCKSVRALAKEINGKIFELTCPPDLMASCQNVDVKRVMPAPADLAESVALLVIKLAEER